VVLVPISVGCAIWTGKIFRKQIKRLIDFSVQFAVGPRQVRTRKIQKHSIASGRLSYENRAGFLGKREQRDAVVLKYAKARRKSAPAAETPPTSELSIDPETSEILEP